MTQRAFLQGTMLGSEAGERLRLHRRARNYLAAFVAGILLSLASFYATLSALRAADRLPPPPVSGTWCIDSRFAWLKDNPGWKRADIVAVGSSATWRNLDFGVIPSEALARGVVNAAPCFLTVNQTRHLTEFLVERAPQLTTAMMVLAPRDFQGCSGNPTAFFDPDLVDQYLDGRVNERWLRFRNFRLRDVFFHTIHAGERRALMKYDRYGSGPLTRKQPDTGHPFLPELECYSELTRLAASLESRGIQFIVATFPVMQGWARLHDRSGATQAQFRSAVEAALAPTKAILVDGMADWPVPDSAFADPVHLQWPETAAFTRFVWEAARQEGADLPPLKEGDERYSEPDNGCGSTGSRWGGSCLKDRTAGMNGGIILAGRNSPGDPRSGVHSETEARKELTITSPMLDAIIQNARGYSEGYAVGVPRTYAWCSGSFKPPATTAPPSNFTAVTGWGQVYPKVGAPAYSSPDGAVIVANAKTYVHLSATREWILVQNQATNGISGAHFVADFSPKAGIRMKLNAQPDGSVIIGPPPEGYNDHFWITKRGTYAAGSVDGVYVQMDIRTNDPNLKLVANVGADWWRDATAEYVHGFKNNPGAGMSNWVELSTKWSTLRFYSWSNSRLRADPPPPLAEPSPAISPPIVRRRASPSAACLSGL